jgi:lipoprotein-releasing system ATP-binding protein
MMGQSGIINELRLRLDDPLIAQKVATQVEAQTGYKSVSWQEANSDLLSSFSVRDFIVLTVMGAMLLTSSFASYNIISTITHEKRQDIAIMKSLGMRENSVRRIFIIEAAIIGVVGILFGWVLGYALCYGWSKITIYDTFTGTTLLHGRGLPCAQGDAGASRRDHPGRLMSDVALEAVGLVRRIEGAISHTLVNGIDLKVEKGEFLAITGPSGSGKSSLLYLLGLLDAPTEGEVIICGQPTSKLSESERADVRLTKCGFVFQFHFLLPEFTSLQNVLLPMRAAGKMSETEMRERGLELLASLGLKDHAGKRPNQLSGGQRQRVAIARALSNRPEVIVADEPTGALDTSSTEQVFAILREIADSGRTVVVVTHDPALAARADRRLNIVDGRIQEMSLGDGRVSSAAVVAER